MGTQKPSTYSYSIIFKSDLHGRSCLYYQHLFLYFRSEDFENHIFYFDALEMRHRVDQKEEKFHLAFENGDDVNHHDDGDLNNHDDDPYVLVVDSLKYLCDAYVYLDSL